MEQARTAEATACEVTGAGALLEVASSSSCGGFCEEEQAALELAAQSATRHAKAARPRSKRTLTKRRNTPWCPLGTALVVSITVAFTALVVVLVILDNIA